MYPRPRNPTNALMKKQKISESRASTSHAHDLDPRPTAIPPPILINDDTWLYHIGVRKQWVRSREPVDWKQVGIVTRNRDLTYDSDETIDDQTHPPTKAEDQSPEQQRSQQKVMHKNSAYNSNLPPNDPISETFRKETKRKPPVPAPPPSSQLTEIPLTSSSTNNSEIAYDTDATISEPIDEEESPDQKEVDRKIFQNAMRQRRAWNLENEEEGMSAKVPLPVYNTRIV